MRSTASEGVDAILDAGAVGLRYFEVFLPRYREWTGHEPAGGGYFALAAHYDQQRGTDLEALRGIATALGEELEGRLGDQAAAQNARFADLPNHWNGSPAADNARQFLALAGTGIGTTVDALRAVHTAATTALTRIEDAVRHKADTVKNGFDAATAAGKSAQQIDWLIDVAQGTVGTGEAVRNRLRTELPEHHADGADPAATCRGWLDRVFAGEIEAAVTRFTTLCSDTHTTVSGAYEQLLTALEAVEPSAFVSPGGTPSADTDLTSAPGGPSYVIAAGAPQATTEPESDNPAPGGNPTQTTPGDTESPDAPSSLALTSTPAATETGETVDPGTDPATAAPTGTNTPGSTTETSTTSAPAGTQPPGSTTETSTTPGASEADDSSGTTPEPAASTPGAWTPTDITNMVTAVSQITGTIPDLITAVGSLAGQMDEVITATGDAVATVIDAADNQPSAPGPGTEVTDPSEETAATQDPAAEDSSSESSDTAGETGDTTQEEGQNSQAGDSAAAEGTDSEAADTGTAAVGPDTGTPVPNPAPTHPTAAATTETPVSTAYGSLRGLGTAPAPRPTNDHQQQAPDTPQHAVDQPRAVSAPE
ncbi:DNA polymerase III subunit gamma/tau domain-containing protein [Nocardia sp. X0981]